MKNLLEDHKPGIFLSDKEIFTKIWYSPRMVFKYIHENEYEKNTVFLLVLAGIARALDHIFHRGLANTMSAWQILALCIFGGGLFGWFSYWLYSAMTCWIGDLLGGEGNTSDLLRVLSYAMLPYILGLTILIYGTEVFKSGTSMISGFTSYILVYGLIIIKGVLSIWTIVLCVIGVSEVQKFSIIKTILNLILPGLILILPGAILFFLKAR